MRGGVIIFKALVEAYLTNSNRPLRPESVAQQIKNQLNGVLLVHCAYVHRTNFCTCPTNLDETDGVV